MVNLDWRVSTLSEGMAWLELEFGGVDKGFVHSQVKHEHCIVSLSNTLSSIFEFVKH
jgi:hypothetical protein